MTTTKTKPRLTSLARGVLCAANGATIIKPLTATSWGTKDFYVEDPDGYIVSFGVARPQTERRAGCGAKTDVPEWSTPQR